MPDTYMHMGELAASLAAAQAAFPTIARDKEVTVALKSGGSYKFKYAPLDSILTAVRKPLSENGLAITQLLDSDPDGLPFLVTRLLHKDGGVIEGRTPIPHTDGETVQAFGSAITYLRRYAIQALLGIAAEEDDDGNRAAGNAATIRERNPRAGAPDYEPPTPPTFEGTPDGGMIGIAEAGKAGADFEIRQTPDDGWALAFRLVSGRKSFKVIAEDDLAMQITERRADIEGQTITAWGRVSEETFTPEGTRKKIPYTVLYLSRLTSGPITLPAVTAAGTTEPRRTEAAAAPSGPEPQTPSGPTQ